MQAGAAVNDAHHGPPEHEPDNGPSVAPAPLGVRDIGRMEAFSDAIIAIAITLLVLEIHAPELGDGPDQCPATAAGLMHALGGLWPNYLGYALTFGLLAIVWVNHHNLMRYVGRTTHTLNLVNLAFLFVMALAPFPTAILANDVETAARPAAVLIYAGWNLVGDLAFWVLWWYGSRHRDRTADALPPDLLPAIDLAFGIGTVVYIVAVAIAWWLPVVSLVLIAGMDLCYLFPIANNLVAFIRRR